MTDIVERLRKCACEDGWAILLWQHAQEAADEIERQRAELEERNKSIAYYMDQCSKGEYEIERLQAEVFRLHEWIQRDSDDALLKKSEKLRAALNLIIATFPPSEAVNIARRELERNRD